MMSGYDFVQYCLGVLILSVAGIAVYITYKGWNS